MSDTLALLDLYDAVSARFTTESTPCTLAFGWKARAAQVTGPRIVMVPGDEGGDAGDIGAASQPGRNPRPLATWAETFHVVVSGAGDATDPTNERKAYEATRLLADAWFRAAYLHTGVRMRFEGASWLIDRVTARFSTALVMTFAYEAMIHDTALTETDFDVRGFITASMLDHDETHETDPAPATVLVAARSPITLSGTQTVDGVLLEVGSRVLVIAQADGVANGVYTVASGAWTRTDDTLEHDTFVRATSGTTGTALYRLTTEDPITVGVTAQTWTRITPE